MAKSLCKSCVNSIFCKTWKEYKCIVREKRVYDYESITRCKQYNKRPNSFKERKCQCKDCLNNSIIFEEDLEKKG